MDQVSQNPILDEMIIDDENFLFILDSHHRNDFSMNFHRHDFYELSFVMDGEGLCQSLEDGQIKSSPIRRDNIILTDGRMPHRAVDKTGLPLEQLIIIFDKPYLDKMKDNVLIEKTLEEKNPLILSGILHTAPLKPFFREILNEMKAKESGKDSLIFSIFSRLLVQIIRAGEDTKKAHCDDNRINRVLDYIHTNFFMNITIQTVAEISSLSLRQFSDVFKRETGRTFTQYINHLRIEKAKTALISTRLSITEIAFEIGYDDLSYFTRRFKEQEGLSPRAYKKKNGK
ncbi:AraC family transcriptional regulator [Oceanispirochaeta crateris]|uniref:AraC family transcriptional regulator n=1 Tax=Oceanispirochaeta crateris TaxID=2518645 RepID=A0A5C1QPL5_9SPIO|nr:AraC family transcriptional regulator [Oceanispirochaeta crateris]QEN09581.1 AraC family transcriptional regulator [Oceanispirochaeta crateris]